MPIRQANKLKSNLKFKLKVSVSTHICRARMILQVRIVFRHTSSLQVNKMRNTWTVMNRIF
jgi:hypothetical protein